MAIDAVRSIKRKNRTEQDDDEEEAGAGDEGDEGDEGDDPVVTAELSPGEVQARKLHHAKQAGHCIDLTTSGPGDVSVKEEKHAPVVDLVTTEAPDAPWGYRWISSRPKPKFSDLFASLEACPAVVQANPRTRQELAELKGKHVQVLQSGQMNKRDLKKCVRQVVGDAALEQALIRLGFQFSPYSIHQVTPAASGTTADVDAGWWWSGGSPSRGSIC